MRDLEKALADISEIRSQMARDLEFRGYGPATLAATGGLAILSAIGQALWLRHPLDSIGAYIALWGTTAAVSVGLIGLDMVMRTRRIHSGLAQEMIWSAVEQFLPACVAGVLITAVLLQYAREDLWMLPGPAPGDLRGRYLVPGGGTLLPRVRAGRRSSLALGHGCALWRGSAVGRVGASTLRRRFR